VVSAGIIVLAVAVGCQSSERKAAEAARNTSEVAASAEQKQLWQDAADKGLAPGLQRVPVVTDPVAARVRAQVPAAPPNPAPPQVTITAGVRNELRILVYPDNPFESYTGPATVTKIEQNGDLIHLELPPAKPSGKPRTLALLVRIDTKRLPVKVGEMVSVAYRVREDPQMPNDEIAIRITGGGAGIAHVIRGSKVRIMQSGIPLFGLNAAQADDQPGAPVQFTGIGLKPIDLRMGQTGQVDVGVVARVLGSDAPGPGALPGLTEGAPFTLNVMVWKVP
jgi:hypothetical protein